MHAYHAHDMHACMRGSRSKPCIQFIARQGALLISMNVAPRGACTHTYSTHDTCTHSRHTQTHTRIDLTLWNTSWGGGGGGHGRADPPCSRRRGDAGDSSTLLLLLRNRGQNRAGPQTCCGCYGGMAGMLIISV